MNLTRWILQRKPEWEELESLLNRVKAFGIKSLSSKEILHLGSLYRSVSADLSRARVYQVGEKIEYYLNDLTGKAHNIVYKNPPMNFSDIQKFFFYSFPCTFRQYFPQFILALLFFWIGSVIAMTAVHIDPVNVSPLFLDEAAIESLKDGKIWTDELSSSPMLSSFILVHNIKIALSAFAYGIFFGIGTLYILFFNGFSIGGTVQVVIENGLGSSILTFISAHGVIELTTIYIAGAAGFIIGWALINPGEYKRWDAVKLKAKSAGTLALGCVFLLIIAGTIEGLVSPNESISPSIKYAIALISAIFLILYFAFAGKKLH